MVKINYPQLLLEVKRALEEDIGSGDVSAALLPQQRQVKAEILSREPLFLAGQAWVDTVFSLIDPEIKITWQIQEGCWVNEPATLASIEGNARSILTAERCALNFLQTLAGTATETYAYVKEIEDTKTRLLDTRKTIPGLRYSQKYAVACAGGMNHRMGLYDAYLIKENHIATCGSIAAAINLARQQHDHLLVEVEVETIQEFKEALAAKPDRILLDNFNEDRLKEAVQLKQANPITLEASGGITLANIRTIALTGVDFISCGAITKSIRAIDLSLLIRNVL